MPHTPSGQEVFFDDFAEEFDAYTAAYDADGSDDHWIHSYLPVSAERAVDLGCGSGRHALLLATLSDSVLAVDISEGELAIARAQRSRPSITYARRSLLDVRPDPDGRFDVVFSFAAIHHLRDHARVLPHIRELVAAGGTAFLVDVVRPDDGWASRDWHLAYAATEADEMLRRTGRQEAADAVYRLRSHPRWLDHVTTSIPLTRDEFDQQYRSVFPGARLVDRYGILRAMHWVAPLGPPTTRGSQ